MSVLHKKPTARLIGQVASPTLHHQHDQLKNALIIKAKKHEPEHFMKCIRAKLVSFIPAPYYDVSTNSLIEKHVEPWTLDTDPNHRFLNMVHEIDDDDLGEAEPGIIRQFLMNYDLVFFTLYSASNEQLFLNIVPIINELIDSLFLSVVFLRGNNGPFNMGYTKGKHVDFGSGDRMELLVDNFEELKRKENIEIFLLRNRGAIYSNDEVNNCIILRDTYICGVQATCLANELDWYFLGRSVTEPQKFAWIVHKTKKVMFIPFYGFSHGSIAHHDLTLYATRFLVYDHLRQSNVNFNRNLYSKIINTQLCDLSFQ